MINRIIRISIMSVFLLLPFTELGASGLGLKLVGARAFALAGAFRGVANDFSAAYWNPAGMNKVKWISNRIWGGWSQAGSYSYAEEFNTGCF